MFPGSARLVLACVMPGDQVVDLVLQPLVHGLRRAAGLLDLLGACLQRAQGRLVSPPPPARGQGGP